MHKLLQKVPRDYTKYVYAIEQTDIKIVHKTLGNCMLGYLVRFNLFTLNDLRHGKI